MEGLKKHEIFEMEVLEKLKNAGFLDALVFGGGTMLRLCYELNRYSADLDFWFIRKVGYKTYFERLRAYLDKEYELADAQMKYYTLLFEFRSQGYPRKLKIEIRKWQKGCEFEEKIAFCKYSTKQVLLRVHTLRQAMGNKIEAAIERKEIRDCFDIEFLLMQGVPLPAQKKQLIKLRKVAEGFEKKDYNVTLGSVLEPEMRRYYRENRFNRLIQKILQVSSRK